MHFIERLASKFVNNKIAIILFRPLYRFFYRDRIISKKRKYFLKNSSPLMKNFNLAFQQLHISYWLAFGTLLGAIREKGFIQHDLDIDVGVFRSDRTPELQKMLEKYGFKKLRSISLEQVEVEETYQYQNVSIDIFYFEKSADNLSFFCYDFIRPSTHVLKENEFVPRKITWPFNGFSAYNFMGIITQIPSNYKELLSAHYGADYMIPNPSWNTLNAPTAQILADKLGIVKQYNY